MSDEEATLDALKAEYLALSHAMQSGVAICNQRGDSEGTSKHLRTGVNSAMVETSALVRLLIDKGIITDVDWHLMLVQGMREEVSRYEKRLSERTGAKVTLT